MYTFFKKFIYKKYKYKTIYKRNILIRYTRGSKKPFKPLVSRGLRGSRGIHYRSTLKEVLAIKSENQIQSEILLEINRRGHRLWRANAGKVKNEQGMWIKLFPKGFPDTVGFHKETGQFIVIEVKNEKGRLRPDQQKFAEFAETQPILYGVARSVEDAIKIVEGEKQM